MKSNIPYVPNVNNGQYGGKLLVIRARNAIEPICEGNEKMKLHNLRECLDQLFDPKVLEKFPDHSGFTTEPAPQKEIRRIGYATNLNPQTVNEAVKSGTDLIITHHDAWDFIFGMKEYCITELKAHGIAHYFAHAPLDDADFGTNTLLLRKLGAREIAKSNLFEDTFYCGRIGEYAPPMSFTELTTRLEHVLEEPVRAWRNHERPVRRICVVTGGGMLTSDVREAVEAECDVYITGEMVLYTIEYARFAGINLIIGSHTFTEIFGVEGLAIKIKESFPEVELLRLPEEHLETRNWIS